MRHRPECIGGFPKHLSKACRQKSVWQYSRRWWSSHQDYCEYRWWAHAFSRFQGKPYWTPGPNVRPWSLIFSNSQCHAPSHHTSATSVAGFHRGQSHRPWNHRSHSTVSCHRATARSWALWRNDLSSSCHRRSRVYATVRSKPKHKASLRAWHKPRRPRRQCSPVAVRGAHLASQRRSYTPCQHTPCRQSNVWKTAWSAYPVDSSYRQKCGRHWA